VLRRLYLVFLRYAEHNLRLDRVGGPLRDAAGRDFGWIDAITVRGNRLTVTGWSIAPRVGLALGRTRLWTKPALIQPGRKERGFTLDIPFEVGDPAIYVCQSESQDSSEATVCRFGGITAGQIRTRKITLIAPYIWALVKLLPTVWRWKNRGDLGARELVKQRLGLVPVSRAVPMNRGGLSPLSKCSREPVIKSTSDRVTIVLPVYNAFDVLVECLERVANHTQMDWHMIAIEDQSTDPRVWPMLEAWAKQHMGRVTLLRNDVNLGFVGAVNRGLAQALVRGAPVVVLNSDALLPDGWAARLLAPLADSTIATVTPMSNDGEIFNVPVICARHDLRAGEADALDKVARRFDPLEGLVEAPTGVGYCLAMSHRFLAQVPQFDTAFGKGYGEETDWCQRVRMLGGRHVCTPALFVEHRGGSSFGATTKQVLLERNGAKISRRYPQYDKEVQSFIRTDPAATSRLALGLAWAAGRQDELPVYLAHSMGGGAEQYLSERIARDIECGLSSVVLRVGQGHDWAVELHSQLGKTQGLSNDLALIQALLSVLPRLRLIYSCGVGARDALGLPKVLLNIASADGLDHPIEVLLHDFFPVSPSYTLLGKDGVYRGVPLASGPLAEDTAHQYSGPEQLKASLADWQASWGALIDAAQRCVVFSTNTAKLLAQAYPIAADKTSVVPHELLYSVPRILPVIGSGLVIGVLGNIGHQKGAALLQKLARDLDKASLGRLVVIGNVDPSWPLPSSAVVHGGYELRDLPGLVRRYDISGWFIPSIWPETFSFTTHEALATGMPVVSLDLGAQGDAVRAARAKGAPATVIPILSGGEVDAHALIEALHLKQEA